MEVGFFGRAACLGQPVDYYLLRQEGERPTYGVQVVYGEERSVIPNISLHAEAVCELLDKMAQGVVTPVTALDVVEDWLEA